MYDIIIKDAKIVDGSGCEPYFADIAIKGGKIAAIGSGLDSACTFIDAKGLVASPGFIDSHSHSDSSVFTAPQMREKVEQGITTAITGQCGGSPAPLPIYYDKDSDKEVEGYGKERDIFKSMSSFLEYASRVPQGCNSAQFVGHATLRKAVMGLENRAPTESELKKMKELLREGMRAGAYGMSIGLYYAPGSYAKTEEIVELAKVVREEGGVLSAHIRGESAIVLDATREFINIVKASGVRGVHSHIKACAKENYGKVKIMLDMIDEANREGADIYCDVYPYVASHTSLGATFVPRDMHANGEIVKNLQIPEKRELAKQYVIKNYGAEDFSWVYVVRAKNRPDCVGKTIEEIAKDRKCSPFDAIFDIITDSANSAGACYFRMDEGDLESAITHPRSMICTDAGVAKISTSYHPRLRASFPRAIGRYARDKKLVSIPEMIRKMTSLPAQVYGLSQKGLLHEGYDADICIFSEEKLIDRADYTNCTLGCEGLNYVIVGGEIVVCDSVHNGKRCGKVMRRGING